MRNPKGRPGRKPSGKKTSHTADAGGTAAGVGQARAPLAEPDVDQAARMEEMAPLYQEHYRSLVRLAALLVYDLAAAEEIVQEAFAEAHGRWSTLPDHDAALRYLRQSLIRRSRTMTQFQPATGTRVAGPPRERPGGHLAGGAAGTARPPARGPGPAVLRRPARGRDRRGDRDEDRRHQGLRDPGDVVLAHRAAGERRLTARHHWPAGGRRAAGRRSTSLPQPVKRNKSPAFADVPHHRGSLPLISRGWWSVLAAGGLWGCCRREA